MVRKILLWCYYDVLHFLARNADWDASDCCFHEKTCLKQGPRMLKIKNELLSYVFEDCQLRGHTALVRKQVYLMATNSCFLLPSLFYFLLQQLPRWTLRNVFLKLKFRGHPGANQGPLGLQPNALPLSYTPLSIVNRQSTLFLRVYMKLVRKRSFFVLLWFFSLSCPENQTRCFKFPFPGEELLWRRDLAYRR